MPIEILSAFIQVVGGVLFGIFITRMYANRDRAREKIIESWVTSAASVDPKALGLISMSVDLGRSKGKPSAKKQTLHVKSVYHHVIDISNVGTDVINEPEIDISFEDGTSIIEIKVRANDITPDKIDIQKDLKHPNHCRIIPQYLNRKNKLTISIVSANNETRKCDVDVVGMGLIHQRRGARDGAGFLVSNSNLKGLVWAAAFIAIVLAIAVTLINQFAPLK